MTYSLRALLLRYGSDIHPLEGQDKRKRRATSEEAGAAKRASLCGGLAERFAFQKFHGDVVRAVIGLAGFVNGDDVRVMNASGGSRFILKTQQEVGVIKGSNK